MWKTLKQNKNYEINEYGIVKNKNTNHTLSGNNVKGYLSVKLSENGIQKRYYIHRLVAEYFVNNSDPKNKTYVNHIDGNKSNNNYTNLEWVTPRENVYHYYQYLKKENKKRKQFEKSIPVNQYTLEGKFLCSFPSISQAHKATGISVFAIANCLKNNKKNACGFIWEYSSTTTSEENPTSVVQNA